MKKVFSSTAELTHVWASQSQEEGRAGNVSFQGQSLYSYGWYELARIIDSETVLIRNYSYSSSTGKHRNRAIRATKHMNTIFCRGDRGDLVNHEANIAYMLTDIKNICYDMQRTFSPLTLRAEFHRQRQNCIAYCTAFSLPRPEFPEFPREAYEKALARANNREAKRAERIRMWTEKGAELIQEVEEKWCQGVGYVTRIAPPKGSPRGMNWLYFSETRIRLSKSGEEVETSQGARVPVEAAKLLHSMIVAGKDVKGFRIGAYTVISINGTLKIGCHEITREEINRFAGTMNW